MLGSLLVTAGLMLGIYAVVKSSEYGWGSAHTLGSRCVAVALLAAFFVRRVAAREPDHAAADLPRARADQLEPRARLPVHRHVRRFFLGTLYLEHVRGYGALRPASRSCR